MSNHAGYSRQSFYIFERDFIHVLAQWMTAAEVRAWFSLPLETKYLLSTENFRSWRIELPCGCFIVQGCNGYPNEDRWLSCCGKHEEPNMTLERLVMRLKGREEHPNQPSGQAREGAAERLCANCGHSYEQHTKGIRPEMYCRHCPCPEWVEPVRFEPLLENLTHTRSCPSLTPGHEEDCTCGLVWRIRLRTEMEMHNAWRKRAEEAEAKLVGREEHPNARQRGNRVRDDH